MGLRWWGAVNYVCTMTSSCCCPLQLSTTKKKKHKSVKSSLAHWSSNVTTQLRSCWLTMTMTQRSMRLEMSTKTWHGTHFILSLGGKLSFIPRRDTIFFLPSCFSSHLAHGANTSFQPHVWVALLKILFHAIWETGSLDFANFQHQMEATVGRV